MYYRTLSSYYRTLSSYYRTLNTSLARSLTVGNTFGVCGS